MKENLQRDIKGAEVTKQAIYIPIYCFFLCGGEKAPTLYLNGPEYYYIQKGLHE